MAWSLNRKGYDNAVALIEKGAVTEDAWSPPTLDDFNGDVEAYSLFHLAVNPELDPETAQAYGYPFGKDGKVYLQALRAIRSASAGGRGAEPNQEIFDASGRLLEMAMPDEEAEKTLIPTERYRVFKRDDYRRIVTGPVLVPNEPDLDGDIVSEDQVMDVAYKFMENYQNIDLMHTFKNVAIPVESYILPEAMTMEGVALPKGTWILSAKILDDETWGRVLDGTYKGFSITAIPAVTKSRVNKKSLDDLGPDWEVAFVSIVDEPAVPKARYVAVKNLKDGDNVSGSKDEKGVLMSILATIKEHLGVDDDGDASAVSEPVNTTSDEIKVIMESLESLKQEIEDLKSLREESKDIDESENPEDDEVPEEASESGKEKEEEEEELDETKTEEAKPKSKNWQVNDTKRTIKSVYDEIGIDVYGRTVKK